MEEAIELIQDALKEYFESRCYDFYNMHTIFTDKNISYEEYRMQCLEQNRIEIESKYVNVKELKKHNEEILKNFIKG